MAFTNDLFQGEFARSRKPWCVSCHAPNSTSPETIADTDRAALRGVDCVACHVKDGQLWSKTRAAQSPHQTQVDPTFGNADDCASCHEFAFPVLDASGHRVADTRVAMQATVSQFRRSAANQRGETCATCHQNSPSKHRFDGSHSVDMLRDAAELSACLERDGTTAALAVTVKNVGVGHSLPSGGVHRYAMLSVWRSSAPERMFEARYGRWFSGGDGPGKALVRDTTIKAGDAAVHRIALSSITRGDPSEPINIELRYVYGLPPSKSRKPSTRSQSFARQRRAPAELPDCSAPR